MRLYLACRRLCRSDSLVVQLSIWSLSDCDNDVAAVMLLVIDPETGATAAVAVLLRLVAKAVTAVRVAAGFAAYAFWKPAASKDRTPVPVHVDAVALQRDVPAAGC